MSEIRKRTFHNTAAALAEYDAGTADRNAAWDRADNDEDVEQCIAADDTALALVQEAFHRDTADINSLENCYRVDLAFMRRMAS